MTIHNNLTRSNSLTDLVARIRAEHQATADALKSSVEHAMAAGDLLIEAKAGAAWPVASVAPRAL